MIKITSVTFYEGKERVDLVRETNIKYSEVGGYKIFKIGGFVARGRGYSQRPPASKLKNQTPPPHPQKNQGFTSFNSQSQKSKIWM